MIARWKIWLAYPAMAVGAFAMINFFMFMFADRQLIPVFISHPLGLLAGAYVGIVFIQPAIFGRLGKHRELPPPGRVVATGQCGGEVGPWMRYNRPPITVTVYSDRMVLRGMLMGEYSIHGSEIRSLGVDQRSVRGRGGLLVEHVAPGKTSPVVLNLAINDPVRHAISQISREPLPAGLVEPVTQESRTQKTAHRIAKNLTTWMLIPAILMGIGFCALGVVKVLDTHNAAYALFAVVGVAMVVAAARELVKHERKS